MDVIIVERVGGLAGFGGPGTHIESQGQVQFTGLSEADQRAVENLFKTRIQLRASALRDGFSYRISRTTPSGTETIEVPEAMVPAAIASCVQDELK